MLDKKTGAKYWLGETRLVQLYKKKAGEEYEVLEKVKGATLEGKRYTPLFPYFASEALAPNFAFRVVTDAYVTDADGTGIVHQVLDEGRQHQPRQACMDWGEVGLDYSCPRPVFCFCTHRLPPLARTIFACAKSTASSGRVVLACRVPWIRLAALWPP